MKLVKIIILSKLIINMYNKKFMKYINDNLLHYVIMNK